MRTGRRVLLHVLSGLLFWLLLMAPTRNCFAQTTSVAQISGIVRDPSGAPIPGALVRITQTERGTARDVKSDDQGRYVAPELPVGPYKVEVSADGFKTYLQTGIVLQVGNNIDVSVPMQIGATSEQIDVTAQAAMVESSENTISQVIDERRIVDLPLNGRQPTQLILLAGASVNTPGVSSSLIGNKSFFSSVAISVAGGQGNSVNYLLDGGDNNDAMTNVNLPIPFPDALQEFAVQTSSLPARYGLHPGAVVNAVTRSGTNDAHGSLFEFLRNGDLNARNYFAPTHDTLKRNQFGGTFGDRIIKDKLFFFGGFQGTFNRQDPPQTVSFVPTAAILNNGDFSVFDGSGCVSGGKTITLMDPTTGQPFQGNQIPVSRFSPVAVKLASYLPATQNPCGRITYGLPTTGDEDQEIVRIDWVQSAKNTVYGRYFIDDYRNPEIYNPANILTAGLAGNLELAQSATIGDTYTFSPTVLNSAHFTFTRRRNNRGPAPNAINSQTLGIDVPSPVPNVFYATVSGDFTAGCNACAPAFFNVNSFSFADDVDIIRGGHQMAFGVEAIRDQFNSLNAAQENGSYTFNGQYATGKSVNDAMAAFMLGVMSDFNQSAPQLNATRETVLGAYAQDSIRLTPRLTINVGLRWEPALVPYDKFNQGEIFSRAAFNAGQRSTVFTNAPAGLLFYGDPGVPRGFQHGSLALFSPRVGIVWDPTGNGRQTIRISGAILRDTIDMFYGAKETSNVPYGTSVDRPFPYPAGTFANPWGGYPGGAPFPLPSPLPSTFTFPNGGAYSLLSPNYTPPYMAQWNLSYQRQITSNWLASVSYLGNKTTHIFTGVNIDPAVYIPGSTANTSSRTLLYLQNPALGAAYSSIVQSDPNGNSNYNALLLSLQHRFSRGFTWLTNYTWSHCLSTVDHIGGLTAEGFMNPNSLAQDYGNCIFDVRHLMNTSVVATSPVKGNGLVARVFGQWQFAPILTMHTGLPINILDGTDISETGINLDRPNYVGGVNPVSSGSLQYLNRAAFQNQTLGTFGNLGRDALYAPGTIELDAELSRVFRVRERWQLTPRFEAFNVINHSNFSAPNTTLSNSQFGLITAAADPRILQASLKLQF